MFIFSKKCEPSFFMVYSSLELRSIVGMILQEWRQLG